MDHVEDVWREIRRKRWRAALQSASDTTALRTHPAGQHGRKQIWGDDGKLEIRLITGNESHLPFLLSCNDDILGMRMVGYSYRVSPQRFLEDLRGGWNVLQIIEAENPIGFVRAAVRVDDHVAAITIYLIPEARDLGLIHWILLPFLTNLFEALSMHSVQAAVWAFNSASLNNFGKILRPEAIIRDDAYFQGKHWDRHIFNVLEQEWPELKSKLAEYEQRAKSVLKRRIQRTFEQKNTAEHSCAITHHQ